MFNLTQIRCFVVVADELHFGRAASRLNMTQPPLSRQIQVLETTLNAQLFDRTSRSVKLTIAGKSFLPEAKRMLKLAESAALVAKRIALGKAGALKIGFTAAGAYSFMPEFVKSIRQKLPDVDLSLKEMVSGDQLEALNSGQIDIGLLRPPVARAELNAIRVVSEPLIAALPANHELAAKDQLSLADFDGQAFVMYAPYESRYFYDLLVGEFAKANILPDYVQHLSQIHSILSLVRAGLGLALVPNSAGNIRMSGVEMRPVHITAPRSVELYFVWRKDAENPLLPAIVELVQDLAGKEQTHY